MAGLYPKAQDFISEKQLDLQKRCEASLAKHAITQASTNGDFKMHYYCGLLIHQRIAKELQLAKQSLSLSDLWQAYRQGVKAGKGAGQAPFLDTVQNYCSNDVVEKLDKFIKSIPENPRQALNKLAA